MDTWVTKELASYAVATRLENHPREAWEAGKIFLLDSLGCMLGGRQTALGQAMVDPIRRMGGAPEATLVGGGCKLPTIQAALVNGTTANALDYDDTLLGIGHPGSTVIPAALAMGEREKASGRDILNAILIGYDVGDRIGLGIQPTTERLQQVWGVGTWQTFGAVVAAGKVLGFDLDRMLNAFGVAGTTAPLPNTQKWGWALEERPIHWVKEPTGWPAWTGVTAAVLAASGFVGNRFVLDGDNGFWIMAGSDRCDHAAMTRGLGERFEVLENIAIKPYSSCRWQHAALDAVMQIKQEHNLTVDDIERIVVHSFAWVKSQELYGPQDMVDAQFCIPYTVTMAMLGVHPGPAWYTPEHLASDAVLQFSKRVSVELDEELNRDYFDNDRISARVQVTATGGRTGEALVPVPSGDPQNPLSRDAIEAKFKNQASYCLNDAQIQQALDRIDDFENLRDISELMGILAGGRT